VGGNIDKSTAGQVRAAKVSSARNAPSTTIQLVQHDSMTSPFILMPRSPCWYKSSAVLCMMMRCSNSVPRQANTGMLAQDTHLGRVCSILCAWLPCAELETRGNLGHCVQHPHSPVTCRCVNSYTTRAESFMFMHSCESSIHSWCQGAAVVYGQQAWRQAVQ
jgi:hypothetical protein